MSVETTVTPTSGSPPSVEVQGPTNSLTIADSFKIRQVDDITVARAREAPQVPIAPGPVIEPLPVNPLVEGSLGILSKFVGTFQGTGMNMIFRPNTSGSGLTDNILEFNLTTEKQTFLQDIGDVPNRGFAGQPDLNLKAVPYTQQISDRLNKDTGKADLPTPIPIHFEQGLFVRTPQTVNPDVPTGTISRMGSIPHGTTINAQGIEPTGPPVQGAPDFGTVSIIPFTIGNPDSQVTAFANLKFEPTQLRIPQDFTKFNESGALTQAIFQNPNEVLRIANTNSSKKQVKEHIRFELSTEGTNALPGGGTANIAFLQGPPGNPLPAPNAHGASMKVTYWISTVLVDVVIPEGHYAAHPTKKLLSSEASRVDKVSTPKFLVELKRNVSHNTTVKLSYTQIQYSQNVSLNFGGLTWPHISVATLQPGNAVFVKADSPLLANLK
ncbi:hypothetical protein EJ05DRAFT_439322 [Pseudovirgaria hyperparasitica]|uniref:Uncharacterized protein n=1 Tax=Pseudovirgaria hyperparasitica TaxID=470096 RepID=A0A6A6W6N6_9PEZI|nr:uncharacterized protein EJ05DRAFT_439322 [Pseudovirgaria hyperparasitica]KAF2758205.1 hypothetical protein EJ05DRAFT_439322 [Pseudovirgaria hyperparasitica]